VRDKKFDLASKFWDVKIACGFTFHSSRWRELASPRVHGPRQMSQKSPSQFCTSTSASLVGVSITY
jgi:hypothetical protein